MGITIEQGVIATIIIAVIGLLLRSIDRENVALKGELSELKKEMAEMVNSETAEARFKSIESSLARVEHEQQRHAEIDRMAFERIYEHMDDMRTKVDALPDRIIARLKETKL